MPPGDFSIILPITIIALTAIAALVVMAIRRNHTAVFAITILGIIASFAAVFGISGRLPRPAGTILVIDQYSLFFMGLILLLTAAASVLSYIYFKSSHEQKEELYVLMLIGALGGMILASANHFVSFFLGLEILTVALYVMIAFIRDHDIGLEAGVKYLVLAAAASAFLVLGIALIFAETGKLDFSAIADILSNTHLHQSLYGLIGIGLIIVGIGFKLGVVPFHMWTPDVYQGAPAPITGFIASVSKSAMLALLLRFIVIINLTAYPGLMFILGMMALLSMVIGNILALTQTNIKRLLAYSSIAHLGYLLVAVMADRTGAYEAAIFYMTVYSISILGAFGLVAIISKAGDETDTIDSYRGLFWRNPFLAAVFSIMLFSLGGIPLTAGFIGKYFVVLSGIDGSLWLLVTVLIVSSVIGLYYYLRVIAVMVDNAGQSSPATLSGKVSYSGAAVLAILSLIVLFLGIYPGPMMGLIHQLLTNSFL